MKTFLITGIIYTKCTFCTWSLEIKLSCWEVNVSRANLLEFSVASKFYLLVNTSFESVIYKSICPYRFHKRRKLSWWGWSLRNTYI